MLRRLRISNLAIIDELELELGTGLNVLTGETGSGKSILVSALELVLGGKSRGELVRTGASAGGRSLVRCAGGRGVRSSSSAIEVGGRGR